MGLITRIGLWLDHRFPEKMTADEVRGHFEQSVKAYSDHQEQIVAIRQSVSGLIERIRSIESTESTLHTELSRLSSEINTIKTITNIKSRVVGNDIKPIQK